MRRAIRSRKAAEHTVVFDFKYDGPGLSVDGKDVAIKTIPHTIPFLETDYCPLVQ